MTTSFEIHVRDINAPGSSVYDYDTIALLIQFL
jgi:hypothetical protein